MEGSGRSRGPHCGVRGLCPSPGLGSWLSQWLFSICTRFIRGSQFPVSWPWRCLMSRLNPPGLVWCCIPTDVSPSCLRRPLSQPKCHQGGWPRGRRAGQAAASVAPAGSRSLGTEPRLAAGRGGAEGRASLGASWSREFSGFLTPTHHHLMLGWEFWRSHWGHMESRPWERPLVVCVCSFSPRSFGSGAARGARSPASHLKSIRPVSALSWSSFWLFPSSLSGFFSLPPY